MALDITVTEDLANEGLAREIVNRVQNIRKDQGFEVTDNITLRIELNDQIAKAVEQFGDYICSETLATIETENALTQNTNNTYELTDNVSVIMEVIKKIVHNFNNLLYVDLNIYLIFIPDSQFEGNPTS